MCFRLPIFFWNYSNSRIEEHAISSIQANENRATVLQTHPCISCIKLMHFASHRWFMLKQYFTFRLHALFESNYFLYIANSRALDHGCKQLFCQRIMEKKMRVSPVEKPTKVIYHRLHGYWKRIWHRHMRSLFKLYHVSRPHVLMWQKSVNLSVYILFHCNIEHVITFSFFYCVSPL